MKASIDFSFDMLAPGGGRMVAGRWMKTGFRACCRSDDKDEMAWPGMSPVLMGMKAYVEDR